MNDLELISLKEKLNSSLKKGDLNETLESVSLVVSKLNKYEDEIKNSSFSIHEILTMASIAEKEANK